MKRGRRGAAATRSRRRSIGAAVGVLLVLCGLVAPTASAAPTQVARINGTGSTYVGLAMQQWTAEAQVAGLPVNYTPTGSPDGLSRFRGGQVDFAGTEAEFASLSVGGDVPRGYQYVPDVAGAVAVMYNVVDLSGRKVDYLHLSRSTVAKIFMGAITSWSDPQIAADNAPANLRLPDEPINVVYRSGQSGTTALFYDFVREMEPNLFRQWASRNRLPTNVRIIQLDSSPGFAPRTQALAGSDQIAQFVAGDQGRWSIAYDEFSYAKTYGATSAWIQNQAGKWVLPYAQNISVALESARLRPDLSQELSGVYRSPDPLAYPISAYSYLVTQCERSGDRPTCRGAYSNSGVTGTLRSWMRYIACEGQVRMAEIGYSPLPPDLSQEVANSVARLTGAAPERLTASNCANPRFRGSLGAGALGPPDPYLSVTGGGGGNQGGASGDGGAGGGDGGTGEAAAAGGEAGGGGDASADGAVGRAGSRQRTGGGSDTWRAASPAAYTPSLTEGGAGPALATMAVVGVPVLAGGLHRWRRRSGASGGAGLPGSPTGS